MQIHLKGIITCFKCRLHVCQGWLKGLCLFDSHDTAMVSVRLRILVCWVTFALQLGLFVSSWFIGWVFNIPCKAVAFWIPEVFLQENLLRKLVVTVNLCTASNSYCLVHAASVQPFLCELMMRTQFYLNLLVLHFQRRVTDIDCDIFPQLFLLAGHSFTFLVIYCSVTHIFFFGPLSTLCCLCLADKELFVLSQLGAILAISNVGGGIVLTFFAMHLCAS